MPVEFEGDQHQKSILYAKLLQPAEETPGLINWLLKTGVAKTPQMANKILIGVMIISFLLSAYTFGKTYFQTDSNSAAKARVFEENKRNLPPIRITR